MTTLDTALSPALETILETFLSENKQPVFTFRTLDANTSTMMVQTSDGSSMPTVVNASRTVPGATKIRTPEGRQQKLMYSVRERMETVNGSTTLIQEPEPIIFEPKDFNIITVKRTNRELLARLLFSNECQNGLNPEIEEPGVGYVYELIQPAKTAEQLVVNRERVLDAQIAVRSASEAELTLAVQRLNLSVSKDRNDNAKSLYDKAEADPEGVFRVLSDEWDKTTALVRELTGAGVIEFDSNERHYLTAADRKPIHTVHSGNFEQSLIKHLSDTQGQALKRALTRELAEKTAKKGKK